MSMSVALTINEQRKKKKKIFGLFLISFILLLALLLTCVFVFLFSKHNGVESALTRVVASDVSSINSYVDSNMRKLIILSKIVSENQDLVSYENAKTLFTSISAISNFSRISYLLDYGSGYRYDYVAKAFSITSSDNRHFLLAKDGTPTYFVSNSNNHEEYYVPVKLSNGNVLGVFLGEIYNSKLSSYINKHNNNKYIYDIYLVDDYGAIVYKNIKTDVSDVSSIFDLNYPHLMSINDPLFIPDKTSKFESMWVVDNNLEQTFIASGKLNYGGYRVILVYPGASVPMAKAINNLYVTDNTIKINIDKNHVLKIIIISLCLLIIASIIVFSGIKLYHVINKKSYKAVMKWALYDDVTDGFNKPKFYLEVSNILLNSHDTDKYALIFMDINNFAVINKMYDSLKGNDILKDIANSIKWFLEKDGISARIMSDNFVILYKYKNESKIIKFIENLTRTIGEYKLGVKLVPLFGIFKITDFTLPVEVLVDRAIMARKSIQEDFVVNYAFFSKDLVDEVAKAKEIENEMYFALNQNQFIFYLQPQIEISSNKVVGAEALVRWNHPVKGILLPEKFLHLFEKKSFITYMDQYLVEQVCKLISKWLAAGVVVVPISVNLSALNLSNPRFAEMMHSMVEMYNIPPKLLCFEFDETSIFDNSKFVNSIIADLKKFGFDVGLDNFGKSYSSIKILNDFGFDYVKFNMNFIKSLINNVRGRNILVSLNQLVKANNCRSVAIGIESNYELGFITKAEFDKFQGFVNSRPMCITDFEFFVFNKSITTFNDGDIYNG